ncbi:unnamed protein product [Vitrella brassicaformis CCMP3155]|uniref:Methyltransferase type 11 domain-containing protein n=2 Tax=Vitrella brassicaformis TaxID=1169539 RepID=A0A0G4FU48_VITBC|nr:unnamed protein product [Vitrella brassicaformis CCMP3155]|mmetsp:Transcript_41383/g.103293  ORF Transcript_41383/g.103293 Transcript_41383/m.103293 type:complete len:287 (+) Transcript_41383:82-942(+)|eukprot:CEM18488.1 unnamed protein product [Vitrella brassicaformis CCMP3155]
MPISVTRAIAFASVAGAGVALAWKKPYADWQREEKAIRQDIREEQRKARISQSSSQQPRGLSRFIPPAVAAIDAAAPLTLMQSIGLDQWRGELCGQATGRVLEVCVGKGENFPHYDKASIEELVLTDVDGEVLQIARERSRQVLEGLRVETCQCDAAGMLPFPDDSFDCVVCAFGLCKAEDPIEAVREMARVVKSGGKLLLLEHGCGSSALINTWLSLSMKQRFRKDGCFYNRPVERIVQQSGVDILQLRRRHAQTQYMVVASKKEPGALEAQRARKELPRLARGG